MSKAAARMMVVAGMASVIATSAGSAVGAQAYRKPGPAPVYEQPVMSQADFAAWADAYRAWGRPRVMVLAGWSTPDHEADSPSAQLLNTDESGMTHQLKAAFEMMLNAPGADVYLVDGNQARAAAARLSGALQGAGEAEGVRLLAREVGAELVVVLRALDYNEAADAPGKVVARAYDATSSRVIWTLPFDWKGDGSGRNIRVYGEQLAARFMVEYAARAFDVQRYTVRLVGTGDDPGAVRALRDAIRAVPGVMDVTERLAAAGAVVHDGDTEAVQVLEVQFAGGALDLQAELAEALLDAEGAWARIIDSVGTTITLRVLAEGEHSHTRPTPPPAEATSTDAFPSAPPPVAPWVGEEGVLEVVLEGMESADQLEEFLRAIRTRRDLGAAIEVDALVGFQRGDTAGAAAVDAGDGSARLSLWYGAGFERVLADLRAVEGDLPYGLEVERLDRGVMVARVVGR